MRRLATTSSLCHAAASSQHQANGGLSMRERAARCIEFNSRELLPSTTTKTTLNISPAGRSNDQLLLSLNDQQLLRPNDQPLLRPKDELLPSPSEQRKESRPCGTTHDTVQCDDDDDDDNLNNNSHGSFLNAKREARPRRPGASQNRNNNNWHHLDHHNYPNPRLSQHGIEAWKRPAARTAAGGVRRFHDSKAVGSRDLAVKRKPVSKSIGNRRAVASTSSTTVPSAVPLTAEVLSRFSILNDSAEGKNAIIKGGCDDRLGSPLVALFKNESSAVVDYGGSGQEKCLVGGGVSRLGANPMSDYPEVLLRIKEEAALKEQPSAALVRKNDNESSSGQVDANNNKNNEDGGGGGEDDGVDKESGLVQKVLKPSNSDQDDSASAVAVIEFRHRSGDLSKSGRRRCNNNNINPNDRRGGMNPFFNIGRSRGGGVSRLPLLKSGKNKPRNGRFAGTWVTIRRHLHRAREQGQITDSSFSILYRFLGMSEGGYVRNRCRRSKNDSSTEIKLNDTEQRLLCERLLKEACQDKSLVNEHDGGDRSTTATFSDTAGLTAKSTPLQFLSDSPLSENSKPDDTVEDRLAESFDQWRARIAAAQFSSPNSGGEEVDCSLLSDEDLTDEGYYYCGTNQFPRRSLSGSNMYKNSSPTIHNPHPWHRSSLVRCPPEPDEVWRAEAVSRHIRYKNSRVDSNHSGGLATGLFAGSSPLDSPYRGVSESYSGSHQAAWRLSRRRELPPLKISEQMVDLETGRVQGEFVKDLNMPGFIENVLWQHELLLGTRPDDMERQVEEKARLVRLMVDSVCRSQGDAATNNDSNNFPNIGSEDESDVELRQEGFILQSSQSEIPEVDPSLSKTRRLEASDLYKRLARALDQRVPPNQRLFQDDHHNQNSRKYQQQPHTRDDKNPYHPHRRGGRSQTSQQQQSQLHQRGTKNVNGNNIKGDDRYRQKWKLNCITDNHDEQREPTTTTTDNVGGSINRYLAKKKKNNTAASASKSNDAGSVWSSKENMELKVGPDRRQHQQQQQQQQHHQRASSPVPSWVRRRQFENSHPLWMRASVSKVLYGLGTDIFPLRYETRLRDYDPY